MPESAPAFHAIAEDTALIKELPRESVPRLIGRCREIEAHLQQRLTAPEPAPRPSSEPELTYDVAEASAVLHMSASRLTELCRQGKIAASKPGKKWVITKWALDQYLTVTRNDHEIDDDTRHVAQKLVGG